MRTLSPKSLEPQELLEFAGKCLDRARALGAPEADVYVQDETELSVRAFGGEVEALRSANTKGVGIRIIDGGRLGYAYASGLDEEDADQAIRSALENVAYVEPDEHNRLPELQSVDISEQQLGIYDARFEDISTERKVDFALELEAATLDQDPRIALVEAAIYAESRFTVGLANTKGFSSFYRGTDSYCYTMPVAREGDESHSGFGFSMGRSLPELDMQGAAGEAAQRATWLLGARSLSPRKTTVVLENIIAAEFLGAISEALTAEAVQRGRSLFAGKIGQAVASDMTNILDDGIRSGGFGTAPFDDEGVPSRMNKLVQNGVLEGFLYDTYSASRDKRSSTGNARRGSFRSRPRVSPTNFYLREGITSRKDLLAAVSDGVLILQLVGVHTGVNAISGEISLGALGLRIRNGELAEPLREITIAGSMMDMLRNIAAVGDDLRFVPMGGSFGSPTISIENVMVSGHAQ